MGQRILQTGFPGQLFRPIFHGPSASHLANSTILAVLKQLEALEKRALARWSEREKTIPTISEDFGVNIEYVHDNNKNL